ncbi:MAG: SOS response-associated peptidase [Myxococcota bacterium]
MAKSARTASPPKKTGSSPVCGRVSMLATPELILQLFGVTTVPEFEPMYNTAPTDPVLTVRADGGGARSASFMRWGLVPSWAKDAKIGNRLFNARSETAHSKPSFRSPFRKRRCLVLTDGFYEWQRQRKEKLPWRILHHDGQPFALAGLWERWSPPEGAPIETATVLTMPANPFIAEIHDRMPLILPASAWADWLDPSNTDSNAIKSLIQPYPPEKLSRYRVSTVVNNSRNKDARCAAPLDDA